MEYLQKKYLISLAVNSALLRSLQSIRTLAPRRAISRAVTLPMPVLQPVKIFFYIFIKFWWTVTSNDHLKIGQVSNKSSAKA